MVLKYQYDRVEVWKRRGIPHWQVRGGLYFLTWRLSGSIPREQELELSNLHSELSRLREMDAVAQSIQAAEREYFRLLDRSLDEGTGAAFMNDPAIADIVAATLEHDDGHACDLISYSVMPNHVHVIFRLRAELDELVQAWKSVSSHRANKLLGRKGPFWAEGYFDVLFRDSGQTERTVTYVRMNPLKANLRDWRWVWFSPERYAAVL